MLYGKSCIGQALRQETERVAAVVMECDIVAAPETLIGRYGDDCDASRL
jgi:hypothetical protein